MLCRRYKPRPIKVYYETAVTFGIPKEVRCTDIAVLDTLAGNGGDGAGFVLVELRLGNLFGRVVVGFPGMRQKHKVRNASAPGEEIPLLVRVFSGSSSSGFGRMVGGGCHVDEAEVYRDDDALQTDEAVIYATFVFETTSVICLGALGGARVAIARKLNLEEGAAGANAAF